MRYRVGGPPIDALMAELGMNGRSLDGLLAGMGGPQAQDGSPTDASPKALSAEAAPTRSSNGTGKSTAPVGK